jgi:hypothetical protein
MSIPTASSAQSVATTATASKSTKSIGAKKLVVDKTSDNWDDF